METGIPDGIYHVSADGSVDYSSDPEGQYILLKFWSCETFDRDTIGQMAVGDVLLLGGAPQEIHTLERSENNLGETTYVDINGGMAEDGITLVLDNEANCFRESRENDAYVLHCVGARKVTLAEGFLYVDHSSVENPGDPVPDGASGDAAAFPAFIVGRELYANTSYGEIRNGALASLVIQWAP
ncbi:MAG: hypothetical protein ACI3V0_05730 [Faecousia sp.]